MEYKVIKQEEYYRSYVYDRFMNQTKCSMAMTVQIDVTDLLEYSKKTNTKFYINSLYLICKVVNGNENYRMDYKYDTKELICWNQMNPIHYVFFKDTKKCTPVYTEYDEEYAIFYKRIEEDIEEAKRNPGFKFSAPAPNYFDASCMPWISYQSFTIELPDGYPYFIPIINWGKYEEVNGRMVMPVSLRMNHATADGYLVSNFFLSLQEEIKEFVK